MDLLLLTNVINQFGLSIAIGSSTFALTFFFKSIKDGSISATERSFLHTVYFVLRIGMVLIIVGMLARYGLYYWLGMESLIGPPDYMTWLLLAVIIVNATLMTMHKMPMWLGPALAGGSWYMLGIVVALEQAQFTLVQWIGYYLMFLALFLVLLEAIKHFYLPKPKKQ